MVILFQCLLYAQLNLSLVEFCFLRGNGLLLVAFSRLIYLSSFEDLVKLVFCFAASRAFRMEKYWSGLTNLDHQFLKMIARLFLRSAKILNALLACKLQARE